MNKIFILIILFLAACVPQAQTPSTSPENFATHRFVTECLAENFSVEDCDTYIFNPSVQTGKIEVRISGEGLQLNADGCVELAPFEVNGTFFERVRCVFPGTDKRLFIYLNGGDVRVITEYLYEGTRYYLPALKL